MKRLILLFLLISNTAYARIEGVEYTFLEVNGITYDLPIGNPDQKNELFYIKKALKGDKDALDILIGKEEEGVFWIGDESPRWLRLSRTDKPEVIDFE